MTGGVVGRVLENSCFLSIVGDGILGLDYLENESRLTGSEEFEAIVDKVCPTGSDFKSTEGLKPYGGLEAIPGFSFNCLFK